MIVPGMPALVAPPSGPVVELVSASVDINQSMPAYAAGDLILVGLYDSTAPALPSGYTNITTGAVGARFMRLCYKIAADGSESTVGFATYRSIGVYRSSSGVIGVGANDTTTGAGAPRTYPAITLSQSPGWVVGFGFYRASAASQTAPSGMTSRGAQSSIGGSTILSDTAADVSSWSATNVSDIGGSEWSCTTVEITT
jgi:hypothetical protein